MAARFCDSDQFIEGAGRGVGLRKYADRDHRTEAAGLEVQVLAEGHAACILIHALASGHIQHSLRNVHSHEVAIASRSERLARQPCPSTSIKDAGVLGNELADQLSDQCRGSVFVGGGHISVVVASPLVIALF
ncbi:MAG: hypothetical protein C1O27_000525 [Chloroflexi bacterium]|nr:MAG: hypothetical protein C1O27_000525 [Chloroflexota bacterium]